VSVRSDFLPSVLLGDVNLFFLIYMAQEEQKCTGAKYNRQRERDPAVHMSAAWIGVRDEPIEFKNRATQRCQTYN